MQANRGWFLISVCLCVSGNDVWIFLKFDIGEFTKIPLQISVWFNLYHPS